MAKTKPVTVALLGAGARGELNLATLAKKHPDLLKFVAVAEPQDKRRGDDSDGPAHNYEVKDKRYEGDTDQEDVERIKDPGQHSHDRSHCDQFDYADQHERENVFGIR